MAGLDAFKGVVTANDAQKNALVNLMGQMGSAGAEAYKADQVVAQQAAKSARQGLISSNPGIGQPNMSSAVGPGALTQQLAARAAEPGMTAARGAGEASTEFNRYAGLLGQANNNYGNAVAQAAPIVESQTRSKVSQIMADLQNEREARQYEADQRAIARREHEEDRKWELTKRGWELADRNATANGAKPGDSLEMGRSLGFKDDLTKSITKSDAYSNLFSKAMEIYSAYPDIDLNALTGMLTQAENQVDPATGKQFLPGDHYNTLSLVLAQMNPILSRGGTVTRDTGRTAFGMPTMADVARQRSDAQAKADAAAAARRQAAAAANNRRNRQGSKGIPASWTGTDAEWYALTPEQRARVYLQAPSK